ncbi:hypothetical protein [Nocardiopsis alborubida]|uniref:Lactococcin 972 family bacteriocin n=1 Tax=Nocardiopsis alborubida TaxID=146802 RepID=A0A7X6RSC0_9ACTN|nr:hypothetical protein [Nocardiopsis alborubida]NKZ00178.1 hypothetical protein [Nocardiopsis alborubida]
MQRKTLRRFAFTVVAAPVLALGAPALASADSYYSSSWSGAGSDGAYSYVVKSGSGHGHSWYYHSWSHAGPHGAYHSSVSSGSH